MVFFSRETRLKNHQFINKICELWTFVGPFVIDKMWAQFKRANKKHVLLFIINFHVPIILSFNPRTTHQPRFHIQCHPRPI
jgi:hypothetical protein